MAILGFDLNDSALLGYADGTVLFREPGYALAQQDNLLLGWDAWHTARRFPRELQNRHWSELADEVLPLPVAAARTSADLVHAHLSALRAGLDIDCESVSFAVPGYWTSAQLGLLLGIANELCLSVAGFVDSAIAVTRREYPGRDLWHIEPSLHGVCVAQLDQASGAAIAQREFFPGLGIESLERQCAEFFAAGFLKAARFDPLHDAQTEQYLYDQLAQWLGELAREHSTAAEISYQNSQFTADFSHSDLAGELVANWQPLLQKLRSVLPSQGSAVVQVPEALARFPGLIDQLSSLPSVELYMYEASAAARGACRPVVISASRDSLRLLTALPWDQPAQSATMNPTTTAGQLIRPTHLLAGDRAYPLSSQPFVIGVELPAGDCGLTVAAGSAGVSRQHCSIREQAEQLVLVDHSRFGTRLNGHLIEGSAVLQSGDVIGLGTPTLEFQLIAEVPAGGS